MKRSPIIVLLVSGLMTASVLAQQSSGPGTPLESAQSARLSRWAATAPGPASEVVLVKVGHKAITQEMFNKVMRGRSLEIAEHYRDGAIQQLTAEMLFELYVERHPELVDMAQVQKRMEDFVKTQGLASLEEFDRKTTEETGWTLADYTRREMLTQARGKLIKQAIDQGKDEALVRKMFDADPSAWNGTRMRVRHIQFSVPFYATPEESAAERERLSKLREDIVAGRTTWADAVKQSDCPTKRYEGDLGFVPRHGGKPEPFAKLAFETPVGQISEVVETPVGYHILTVTQRNEGNLAFEKVAQEIRIFLERDIMRKADAESREANPLIGVRPPSIPPRLFDPTSQPATRPVARAATRPATRPAPRPVATRPGQPGTQPRPSSTTRPVVRPTLQRRPATRPVPVVPPAAPR